jgi:hypothetical protein
MAGTLNVDTIADNAGTGPVTLTKQQAAKMSCAFQQSDASIRDSFNISSLTDLYVGGTTMNYTSAFSSADHPITATSNWNGVATHDTYTTTSNEIRGRSASSTSLEDRGRIHSIGSGELA